MASIKKDMHTNAGLVESPLGDFVRADDHHNAIAEQIEQSNEIIFSTEKYAIKQMRERCIMAALSAYGEHSNAKEVVDYAEHLVRYILNGKQEESK